MMQRFVFLFLFAFSGFSFGQTTPQVDSLLERCNASYVKPPQLSAIEKEYMHKIPHHICLQEPKKASYEVRLFFQPLDSMIAWHKRSLEKDPDAEVLEPNDLCKSMMLLAVLNASNNKQSAYEVVNNSVVKKQYKADWVATSFVEVGFESVGYKWCRIICIHKDDFGEVYLYFLSDKKKLFETAGLAMAGAIKFR